MKTRSHIFLKLRVSCRRIPIPVTAMETAMEVEILMVQLVSKTGVGLDTQFVPATNKMAVEMRSQDNKNIH